MGMERRAAGCYELAAHGGTLRIDDGQRALLGGRLLGDDEVLDMDLLTELFSDDEYLRLQMGSNMAAVGWDKYYLGSVANGTHKKAAASHQGLA